MPGSISTCTAPAFKSANTSEIKSIPGRTNSANLIPGVKPKSISPAAIAELSASSHSNETERYWCVRVLGHIELRFGTPAHRIQLRYRRGVRHQSGHRRQSRSNIHISGCRLPGNRRRVHKPGVAIGRERMQSNEGREKSPPHHVANCPGTQPPPVCCGHGRALQLKGQI